ncbi:MAG TPA: ABC transporter permease [Erysipelothrix sp.]|nr:ABC transporter permease [Erysipelothrix sp.]
MIKEIVNYYSVNGAYVLQQILRHFLMALYGVTLATLVSVPLGFYIARRERLSKWMIRLANLIQTVPALAMLSLLIVVVGLGPNTVVVAVFLYSILPILSNTHTGVKNVDENVLDVAKAMGMTHRQILFKVELPLSISMILGGVRNALVVAIGVGAIGTFIGAGGLGDIISRGLNVSDGSSIVWAGALPTALMALLVDVVLGQVEKKLVP